MDDGRPVSGSEVGGEKSPQPRAVENSSDAVQGRSRGPMTAQQRIVLLDIWERSGASAEEFGELVGVTGTTLYQWRRRFLKDGPLGLMDKPRGVPKGKPRLPQATQRAIVLMKSQHPDWGCDRIHDMLVRCEGYGASPGAILNVLREAGYVTEEIETSPREETVHRFERARPNQLWQSDLFTFLLKRENRRLWMVAFMDDHSRFVVGYGVWASSGGALVREVLEAAIANWGAPEEVLTDNGPQYATWRGKSAFTKLLEKRGIRHLLAHPRRPQTLGKTERFWGTLHRECLQAASFASLDDARKRVGHFIDYYNFKRPHQGIEGLVPADRFFDAAPEVLKTLQERVAANALDLALHGTPRKSFYLTGRVGETGISLHTEGSRVVLTKGDGDREEVDLDATGRRIEAGDEEVLPEPLAPSAAEPIDDEGGEP